MEAHSARILDAGEREEEEEEVGHLVAVESTIQARRLSVVDVHLDNDSGGMDTRVDFKHTEFFIVSDTAWRSTGASLLLTPPSLLSQEPFIKNELRIKLDADSQLCRDFVDTSSCPRGASCPLRHVSPSPLNFLPSAAVPSSAHARTVCKHWLRGLCKKGNSCEFMHEYNLRKMPECWFFAKYGFCSNGEWRRALVPDALLRRPFPSRRRRMHVPPCDRGHADTGVSPVPQGLLQAGCICRARRWQEGELT